MAFASSVFNNALRVVAEELHVNDEVPTLGTCCKSRAPGPLALQKLASRKKLIHGIQSFIATNLLTKERGKLSYI